MLEKGDPLSFLRVRKDDLIGHNCAQGAEYCVCGTAVKFKSTALISERRFRHQPYTNASYSNIIIQTALISERILFKHQPYTNASFWVEMVHYSAKMNSSSNILRIMTWLSGWDNQKVKPTEH